MPMVAKTFIKPRNIDTIEQKTAQAKARVGRGHGRTPPACPFSKNK